MTFSRTTLLMESMYYIGLDVHKKTISYCVKDTRGQVLQEGRIGATRGALERQKCHRRSHGCTGLTFQQFWRASTFTPVALGVRHGHYAQSKCNDQGVRLPIAGPLGGPALWLL